MPSELEFASVGAGQYHTCGITTVGTVACWGLNDTGQATPPTDTFTSVSAGEDHACGVRIDGAVDCWGLILNTRGRRRRIHLHQSAQVPSIPAA